MRKIAKRKVPDFKTEAEDVAAEKLEEVSKGGNSKRRKLLNSES
jgi:hypothetical protein